MNVQKLDGDNKATLKAAEGRIVLLVTEMAMVFKAMPDKDNVEGRAKLKSCASTIRMIAEKEKAPKIVNEDRMSEAVLAEGIQRWMLDLNRNVKLVGSGTTEQRKYRLAVIDDIASVFQGL